MRIDLVAMTLEDRKLLSLVKELTGQERELQYQSLCYLAEVDRRKLYAVEGYPDLYTFLMEYLGHSESTARKRSQVVRKAAQVPELFYAIKEEKLSLTAASKLCPYLSQDNCEELLAECAKKSVREVEKIIVKHFPKAQVDDSLRQTVSPLSIDQVSVHFTASTEFGEKLIKAQALLSHKYPQGKMADVLGEALDGLLKQFEPKEVKPSAKSEQNNCLDTRHVPRGTRNEVFKKSGGQCEYVSPSGKRCSATRFLHVDHIHPWALGGSSHDVQNLQQLCSEHNRLRAKATFGDFWRKASG